MSVAEVVREYSGVDFDRLSDHHLDFKNYISRVLTGRMLALEISGWDEYQKELYSNSEERDILSQELTINTTSFFRGIKDVKSFFGDLENFLLPNLIKQKQESGEDKLNIWSIPSSTGQEAYSIAMVVDTIIPKGFDFSVVGSDINSSAIETAKKGVYSDDGFENTNYLFERYGGYVDGSKDEFSINSKLKTKVSFQRENIMGSVDVQNVDLVVCKNLFQYFGEDSQRRAMENILGSSNPDAVFALDSNVSKKVVKEYFTPIDIRSFKPMSKFDFSFQRTPYEKHYFTKK